MHPIDHTHLLQATATNSVIRAGYNGHADIVHTLGPADFTSQGRGNDFAVCAGSCGGKGGAGITRCPWEGGGWGTHSGCPAWCWFGAPLHLRTPAQVPLCRAPTAQGCSQVSWAQSVHAVADQQAQVLLPASSSGRCLLPAGSRGVRLQAAAAGGAHRCRPWSLPPQLPPPPARKKRGRRSMFSMLAHDDMEAWFSRDGSETHPRETSLGPADGRPCTSNCSHLLGGGGGLLHRAGGGLLHRAG